MKRWTCDHCQTSVLGPARPRRDDVRRYCLGCSAQTGRLVERRCPTLERERAARADRRQAEQRAHAAKERARRPTHGGIDLLDEAKLLWAHMAEFHQGAPLPAIKIRFVNDGTHTSGGRAFYRAHRVVISIYGKALTSRVLLVLAHELAHSATPFHGHDAVWADCYVKAVRARYGAEHFSGVRASMGYAVDKYVQPGIDRYLEASATSHSS